MHPTLRFAAIPKSPLGVLDKQAAAIVPGCLAPEHRTHRRILQRLYHVRIQASLDLWAEALARQQAQPTAENAERAEHYQKLSRHYFAVSGPCLHQGDCGPRYVAGPPIPAGGWELARRHIGVYGYQRLALSRFAALPQGSLEKAERLEQLRALFNGFTIRVLETDAPHLGVDRPEDVRRIEEELARLR